MLVECEKFVNYYLPAIRAILAHELLVRHGMTQAEVAERLGLTQPAVSQYKKGVRGKTVSLIQENRKIMKMLEELANMISSGAVDKTLLSEKMCEICKAIRREEDGN